MGALVGFVNLPRPDDLDRGVLLQVREDIVYRSDGGGIAGGRWDDGQGCRRSRCSRLRVTKISTEGAENLA